MWNKAEVIGKYDKVAKDLRAIIAQTPTAPEMKAAGKRLKGQIKGNLASTKRKVGKAIVKIGRDIKH